MLIRFLSGRMKGWQFTIADIWSCCVNADLNNLFAGHRFRALLLHKRVLKKICVSK